MCAFREVSAILLQKLETSLKLHYNWCAACCSCCGMFPSVDPFWYLLCEIVSSTLPLAFFMSWYSLEYSTRGCNSRGPIQFDKCDWLVRWTWDRRSSLTFSLCSVCEDPEFDTFVPSSLLWYLCFSLKIQMFGITSNTDESTVYSAPVLCDWGRRDWPGSNHWSKRFYSKYCIRLHHLSGLVIWECRITEQSSQIYLHIVSVISESKHFIKTFVSWPLPTMV